RQNVGIGELRLLVATASPLLDRTEARPMLSLQLSRRRDLGVIQVCVRAVESGEVQLIVAHFAGEVAVIAGLREKGPGNFLERLLELADGRRLLAVGVLERYRPATADVGIVGRGLLEESIRGVALGDER